MNRARFWFWIVMSLFLGGCASAPSKPQPVPGKVIRETSKTDISVSLRQVENRVSFLKNLLNRKGLSREERKAVHRLLEAYKTVKTYTADPVSAETCGRVAETLYEAMLSTDRAWCRAMAEAGEPEPETFIDLALERKRMLALYQKGNYKGVIHRCLALKTRMGDDDITPGIQLLFALSLAGDGMTEQAVNVGLEAVRGLTRMPDTLHLLSEIGRWQLLLHQQQRATRTLDKMDRVHSGNAALISALKEAIQNAAPEEMPLPSVFEPVEAEASMEAGLTPGPFQEEVDALARNHEFEEATTLLQKERAESAAGPKTRMIDRALEKVAELQAAYAEQNRVRAAYLKQTREAAEALYEKEDFEGAIQKIAALEAVGAKTRDLRDRAVLGLINRERNRAAEIFLEAKKIDDPQEKRALLEECYGILESLIDTYPDSPMKSKLMSHLEIVRREMEKR